MGLVRLSVGENIDAKLSRHLGDHGKIRKQQNDDGDQNRNEEATVDGVHLFNKRSLI
jgi:hypothetical protein